MIGTELGNYRIVDNLGRGGMGRVYVGEHRLLGRRAAIKVLDQRFGDDDTIKARFYNEARAISALKHPSIVEIYDFGHAPDGRAFLVMELLTGEPLGRRMKRGVIPLQHTLIFARQIASALAVAHENDVVHRDLKPDNIFIERDPEVDIGERAKVLDFGVAKRRHGDYADQPHTNTGVLLGTPAYMSPEQIDGGEVTARSDIYSLGIVTYRMLTGKLPWDTQDQDELLDLHVSAEPPPPSAYDPRIPEPVERIVMRCLAKRPEDRYESMHEVAAGLAALARLPTEPAGVPQETSEFFGVPEATRPEVVSLPLPTPEDTGVYPPAPESSAPAIAEADSPTTLRSSTGEASRPFSRPNAPRRRWGTIAGTAAAAIAVAALATWGMTASTDEPDAIERPAAGGAAPIANPPASEPAPEPAPEPAIEAVVEPAIVVTPDAAPIAEVGPPDAGPQVSRRLRPGKPKSKRKPKPKPKPKRPGKPDREEFEKPVF